MNELHRPGRKWSSKLHLQFAWDREHNLTRIGFTNVWGTMPGFGSRSGHGPRPRSKPYFTTNPCDVACYCDWNSQDLQLYPQSCQKRHIMQMQIIEEISGIGRIWTSSMIPDIKEIRSNIFFSTFQNTYVAPRPNVVSTLGECLDHENLFLRLQETGEFGSNIPSSYNAFLHPQLSKVNEGLIAHRFDVLLNLRYFRRQT